MRSGLPGGFHAQRASVTVSEIQQDNSRGPSGRFRPLPRLLRTTAGGARGVPDFAFAVTLSGPLRDECGTRDERSSLFSVFDLHFAGS
jgi:hypothetical protein